MYNKKGRSNERPFLLRSWIFFGAESFNVKNLSPPKKIDRLDKKGGEKSSQSYMDAPTNSFGEFFKRG